MNRPSYKSLYLDQVKTTSHKQKVILCLGIIILVIFAIILIAAFWKASQELIIPIPKVQAREYEKTVVITKIEKELVPVTNKTYHCFKNKPEVVEKIKEYFGEEWVGAVDLYCRESSLNFEAVNPSGGACGLVQALPCSKLKCKLSDLDCQLKWGKNYIEKRYQTVANAVKFHDQHNWY